MTRPASFWILKIAAKSRGRKGRLSPAKGAVSKACRPQESRSGGQAEGRGAMRTHVDCRAASKATETTEPGICGCEVTTPWAQQCAVSTADIPSQTALGPQAGASGEVGA